MSTEQDYQRLLKIAQYLADTLKLEHEMKVNLARYITNPGVLVQDRERAPVTPRDLHAKDTQWRAPSELMQLCKTIIEQAEYSQLLLSRIRESLNKAEKP